MNRRDFYLKQLLDLVDNNTVVFVIGVRRSGKSCLALQLEEVLRERCTSSEKVVRFNFETADNVKVAAETMVADFQAKHVEGEKRIILFDEIMHVSNWKMAINFFTENRDCKLVIFSSNRRILSDDLTAVQKHNYDIVEMLPLSYPEFISFQHFKDISPANTPIPQKQFSRFGDKTYTISDIYKYYITYGGLPILKPDYMDIERARVIIDGTYGAIATRDILEVASEDGQQAVTDPILLRSVITAMAKSVGENISASHISKQTTNCLQRRAAAKTVNSYIRALLNANFFYIAERYDVRTGQILKTMAKYYMVDAGLYNYLTGIKQENEIRLLENKVFFELVRRGYQVYNGKLGSKEIHFIAKDGRGKYYVHVINETEEGNKDKTLSLLRTIKDNHPKIMISFNGCSEITEDGIIILNALDFLMGHPLGR